MKVGWADFSPKADSPITASSASRTSSFASGYQVGTIPTWIARARCEAISQVMRAAISIRGEDIRSGVNEGTNVPWWSFTKLVIATAALKLVELGSLDLDRMLSGRAFTLRQLLQHDAGLPDYGVLESYHAAVANGEVPWSADEVIVRTLEAYPAWPPGIRWAYSNIGYYYVGELIQGAAGKGLGEALDALALEPAKVRSTRLAVSKSDLEAVQMGCGDGYDPRWVLHGLLVGPIAEAARYLHSLLSGAILNEKMVGEMFKVHLLPQYRGELWGHPAYGLGMMGAWDGPGSPCGHSGEGPGSGIAVYGKVTDSQVSVAACWESPGSARVVEPVALEMLERG